VCCVEIVQEWGHALSRVAKDSAVVGITATPPH